MNGRTHNSQQTDTPLPNTTLFRTDLTGGKKGPALDKRHAAGAGTVAARALSTGRPTARQPGLCGALRFGQEPVRLPVRAGARTPARLAAPAALVEESLRSPPPCANSSCCATPMRCR